jgi:hypothetical protein
VAALAAPALVRGNGLAVDELPIYSELRRRLDHYRKVNSVRQAYYEASQRIRHLDIAIPPHLQDIGVVCGWAGTAVDVIEERLNWDSWTSSTGDLMGLDEVYEDNDLDVEAPLAQLDALLAGISYVTVGSGDTSNGEPDILVTPESPMDCTSMWDYRRRTNTAALSQTRDGAGRVQEETFYLPGLTIELTRNDNGRLVVTDRIETKRDRIPVSRLVNRARASRRGGRSEITPPVMYLTDAAIRTMLGMEINREFYTTPQRWMMGADMSVFTDENGDPTSPWEAIAGLMLAAPRPYDEETSTWGELPQVGQFTASPPTPYIDQVRAYSMQLAAEVGIPASYLGYATDNPASADAIRAGEARLITRSIRRQKGFTKGWREVAYNVLLWRDGKVDRASLMQIQPNWDSAATPTPQAAADEATKLVAAEILQPDSEVTQRRVGLTAVERQLVASENRKAKARALIDSLTQPSPDAGGTSGGAGGNAG